MQEMKPLVKLFLIFWQKLVWN